MHVLGTDNGNGPFYLFYSGIFTVLVFAGGKFLDYRHRNCHEPWCWRIGKVTVDDRGTLSCFRHHPEGRPQRGHVRARYHLHLGKQGGP